MPRVETPETFAVVVLITLGLVHFAFRSLRARRALVGVPTSAAASVHIGLNRVHGIARPTASPLTAPISEVECAAWSFRIEDEIRYFSTWQRRWRRRWRTAVERHAEGEFELVDDSGSVLVRPEGATIVGRRTEMVMTDRFDPDYLALAPPQKLEHATGRRRVAELIVPLDQPSTVVGTARMRSDAPRPELAWDHRDRRLLISGLGTAVHADREAAAAAGYLFAVAVALASAPFAIRSNAVDYEQAFAESGAWMPILVAGAGLVTLGYGLVYLYNDLVGLRERVDRARSLIAVELARRHDLLPALADVTAAAAGHEQVVLETVTGARSGSSRDGETDDVDTLRSIDQRDAASSTRLLALVEQRPDLYAADNFRYLQEAIVDAENRLALARSFYNDSVTLFNDRRSMAPSSFVSGLLGFRVAPLYG